MKYRVIKKFSVGEAEFKKNDILTDPKTEFGTEKVDDLVGEGFIVAIAEDDSSAGKGSGENTSQEQAYRVFDSRFALNSQVYDEDEARELAAKIRGSYRKWPEEIKK